MLRHNQIEEPLDGNGNTTTRWVSELFYGEGRLENEPVVDFVVGWMTPKGLILKLEDALKWCEDCDFDANLIIKPVVVAKGSKSFEAIL